MNIAGLFLYNFMSRKETYLKVFIEKYKRNRSKLYISFLKI
jgi:hypothetical protein